MSSLNIRDLDNDAKQKCVFDFAKQQKSQFIFLEETLDSRWEAINSLQELDRSWECNSFLATMS